MSLDLRSATPIGPRRVTVKASGDAAGLVLFTLESGQVLITLDSSVMNVSIAEVAEDVGTTGTGIQTPITLCTASPARALRCSSSGGRLLTLVALYLTYVVPNEPVAGPATPTPEPASSP